MMRYLVILLVGVLSACVSTTPDWDSRFGVTTRLALARQIAEPAAAANTDPVAGMDGRSARAAYERYHKAGAEQQSPAVQGGTK
jgi:hypothetical protein